MSTLSIVIPTHHRCDLLRRCLATVLDHAPPATEIVVVDDASPFNSASHVVAEYSGVRVVGLEQRRGFAVAANAGICASRGDIVELLNDDTEVQPGWADSTMRWFDDPRVGAVAPLVLFWPDGKVIDSAGDRYYLGGVAGKRGHRQPLSAEFLQPCPVFGASACAGFYRRTALDQVGLFPESFGSYFEDVDLSFRLQRAGWRTMYEPASRVLHHGSASHGTTSRRLLERQSCNEERVFWRNTSRSQMWHALPKHAAVLAGKAWKRWEEGTLTPWIFGRLHAIKEIRAARTEMDCIALASNTRLCNAFVGRVSQPVRTIPDSINLGKYDGLGNPSHGTQANTLQSLEYTHPHDGPPLTAVARPSLIRRAQARDESIARNVLLRNSFLKCVARADSATPPSATVSQSKGLIF